MKAEEISTPNVPVVYVRLTLEQAEERGVSREELLKGTGISSALLEQPDARISLLEYGRVVARALRKTGDAGLGYDFGLRAGLTAHGLVGFGVMSHRTLGDALKFADKYFIPLRSPGFTTRFFLDGEHAVIDIQEAVQYGPLRQYAIDMALVGFTHVLRQFLTQSEIELWFDCVEPEHYARYRERLPPTRFDTGANQLRCPAAYLCRAVETANPVTAQLITGECDREMAILGHDDRVLSRVRALLVRHSEDNLDLESVAKQLAMSSRTLKRRLHEHGFKFRQLVEEVRRQNSIRLLNETRLSVEEVGRRVGYNAHSNFIRAFRKWTGTTPSAFRARAVAGPT